jgi:hypothetical protein
MRDQANDYNEASVNIKGQSIHKLAKSRLEAHLQNLIEETMQWASLQYRGSPKHDPAFLPQFDDKIASFKNEKCSKSGHPDHQSINFCQTSSFQGTGIDLNHSAYLKQELAEFDFDGITATEQDSAFSLLEGVINEVSSPLAAEHHPEFQPFMDIWEQQPALITTENFNTQPAAMTQDDRNINNFFPLTQTQNNSFEFMDSGDNQMRLSIGYPRIATATYSPFS